VIDTSQPPIMSLGKTGVRGCWLGCTSVFTLFLFSVKQSLAGSTVIRALQLVLLGNSYRRTTLILPKFIVYIETVKTHLVSSGTGKQYEAECRNEISGITPQSLAKFSKVSHNEITIFMIRRQEKTIISCCPALRMRL
jgi:hypothetical protein